MGDQELLDARGRKSQRIARQRNARRRSFRTGLAGALIAGLVLSGTVVATADVGGGGIGGGGGGGGAASDFWLFTGDSQDANNNPMQGWGRDSANYFANAMEQQADWVYTLGSNRNAMLETCDVAINQAIARSNGGSNRARVVQVGVGIGRDNGRTYMGWAGSKPDMISWYQQESDANRWQPLIPGYDSAGFTRIYDTFMASIPDAPRIVCIALNEGEGPNYDLSISTDKQGVFSVAGSTATVRDRINASTPSSTRENLAAQVTLRWGGVEGSTRAATKNATIANSGSTDSPGFTPADFGWASWPAGSFWFDVSVPQQGRMRQAVAHNGQNDTRENWSATKTAPRKVLTSGPARDALGADEVLASGQSYNAEISARTNGYASSMTITDTITTSSVYIGSATGDDRGAVFVEDPTGNRVAGATIDLTRGTNSVVVSGTVTGIPNAFQAQEYKLVVPTFMQPSAEDYSITDNSQVCYTAARNDCIAGNGATTRKVTATPDKLWVIDEAGALVGAGGSADGKTFAPGQGIGAVINGTIPADLAENLNRYELIDDWSGAAGFIDFSDASKAKVFVDGRDVTSQFTITVNGTTTTAAARAEFLSTTKGGAAERSVKLYIGGTLRLDYDTDGEIERLTNAGSERWNNQVVTTNVPAVFAVTPRPDKVWVLDEEGALQASDEDGTNTEGVGGKTFAPGASISAVVNGSVPADLAAKLDSYELVDDWTASAGYVDFSDASKVKVFLDGQNVTTQFDIIVQGTRTIARAKAEFLDATAGRATAGEVKLFLTGVFRDDYDTDGELERLWNQGSETWNGKQVETNVPSLFTVTPRPDKVWVLDEDGALSTSDKQWTDTAGADGLVFLQNDSVSAVVNGAIAANLGTPLWFYSITDDWTGAADYVDFSDASKAKVFYNGVDVTSGFTVNVDGTRTTAVAGPAFLAATAGLSAAGQVKLVVSGVFRDDYDTDGQIVTLTNSGEETWNNRTQQSNSPAVYAWTPNPNKQVLGSSEESGQKAHDDINGTSVWPGQKLEYSVGIDLRIPAGTARGVKSLVVEDVYDPYFVVDKTSVEFWDSRNPLNPRPIPRSAYQLTFDEALHTFRAAFTDAWLSENIAEEGPNSRWQTQGWLTMRMAGMVSKTVPAGSTVVNQAFQIINDARTASDMPSVSIPVVEPDKRSLSTDQLDIDGKTLVAGDKVIYRLLLDAGPSRSELAYNVHKLGMVDDFDEEYLDVMAEDITVTDRATGLDATSRFNVEIRDGVAYVFAKTIDTDGVYGGVIPGDPQAENLKEHDEAAIRPLEDATIDQTLLGQDYWVTIPSTVKKAEDGYVIENQARQNVQNVHTTTRIVSNPLSDIDPSKDVVVSEETKDASIEGTEIRMNTEFNYRLNSSEIPANRAYAATQWSVSDSFDRVHDQYTGIWAIYANADLYDGAELVFAKGDLLQDSAGRESQPWTGMFDVTFDRESYTLRIVATQKYLDLVGSRGDLAHAFSAYAKVLRIAPGEDIVNKVVESYNEYERESNVVDTFTIEYPGIAVEKFTAAEGNVDGSHGDLASAQELTEEDLAMVETEDGVPAQQKGVEVAITFGNAGDVPLKDVTLVDYTHEGLYGQLQGLMCAVPADPTAPVLTGDDTVTTADENGMVWVLPTSINELSVAEEIDCRGTLREMAPGMTHADTVLVTGKSIFSDTLVKAEDSWFAFAPSTPGIHIIEYTLDEGQEVGDRNDTDDALELSAEQAENGVHVAFDVTNTGDEPLSQIEFSNATKDGASGAVRDVKWLEPVPAAPPFEGTPEAPTEGGTEEAAPAALVAESDEEAETPEVEAPVDPTMVEYDGVQYFEREVSELDEIAVDETVLLVGTLTGMERDTVHAGHAVVAAAGSYSGTEVSSEDPWNAKFPKAPAEPPAGIVAGEVIAASDSRKSLLGSSALLLVAAAVVAFMIRRRGARSAA